MTILYYRITTLYSLGTRLIIIIKRTIKNEFEGPKWSIISGKHTAISKGNSLYIYFFFIGFKNDIIQVFGEAAGLPDSTRHERVNCFEQSFICKIESGINMEKLTGIVRK